MKKRRFRRGALAAAIFSAAVNLNGCVYGPPPESEMGGPVQTSGTAIEDTVTEEESSTKYTQFDPADNENEDVYGPPADEVEPEEEFDPEENDIPEVYGPPD